MNKAATKGSGWKDKARETVIGKLVEKSFDYILIGLGVLGAPALVGWFTRSTVTVPVWVLVGLIAAVVGFAVVAALLWWRLRENVRQLREIERERRFLKDALKEGLSLQPWHPQEPSTPPKFEPFPAEDHKLQIGWSIRTQPRHWIETDLSGVSQKYMQQLLDGPFHIRQECHERLSVNYAGVLAHGPMLDKRCPGCREIVFQPSAPTWWWDIRREAALELQRLHRLGRPIAAPKVVLENPRYWAYLEAPP